MAEGKLKILLMGDASNYHAALAVGLGRLGHDVTVASHGSRWMQTSRQIDLYRSPGKLGGALLWLRLNTVLARQLRGYDIVNISSPGFIDQRPARIRSFFDKLKRTNGHIMMTSLGSDSFYVKNCLSASSPLKYSEWNVYGKPSPFAEVSEKTIREWLHPELEDMTRHIYDNVEGAVAALYEYYLTTRMVLPEDRIAYGGIPIDTAALEFKPLEIDGKINIMQACHKGREVEKGADVLRKVCTRIANDFSDRVNYEYVSNIPYSEFQKKLSEAHIIVDQLYSYTPSTTPLLAMAMGKVVVSGAEPEFYQFIGEHELQPIVNVDPANPDALYDDLKTLILNPERLIKAGADGRRFVERHNDTNVVARRSVDFWTSKL